MKIFVQYSGPIFQLQNGIVLQCRHVIDLLYSQMIDDTVLSFINYEILRLALPWTCVSTANRIMIVNLQVIDAMMYLLHSWCNESDTFHQWVYFHATLVNHINGRTAANYEKSNELLECAYENVELSELQKNKY